MSMTTAGYDGRRREGFEKKGNIDKWEEKSKKDSNQICYCAQCLIKIMDDAATKSASNLTTADENQNQDSNMDIVRMDVKFH